MAKFKKGKSGNPAGRPKGQPNKSTEVIRAAFAEILGNNTDKVQEALDRLLKRSPKAYLDSIIAIANHVLPKQVAGNFNVKGQFDVEGFTDFVNASPEETRTILSQISNGDNEENI